MTGVVEAGADRSHLIVGGRKTLRPRERYEDGNRTVVSSFLPDVSRPWTAFDGDALNSAADAGRLREIDQGTNFPYETFVTTSREPSPLTALDVVSRITRAVWTRRESVDGVEMTRYDLEVPAALIADAFGAAAAKDLLVDCDAGQQWAAWLDDQEQLRQLSYQVDHAALSIDVTMLFTKAVGTEPIVLPPESEIFDTGVRVREFLDREPTTDPEQQSLPCAKARAKR